MRPGSDAGGAIAPFIAGCAGPGLTGDEIAFFRESRPAGFILFARNAETPAQVRELCAALRAVRPGAPVLVDQEGGRVARLGPPRWPACASAGQIGALWDAVSPAAARRAALGAGRRIGTMLRQAGINVNCAPVLDLFREGSSGVIGDRAFHARPAVVAALGGCFARGLQERGVVPVIKHCPGHGRADADSHIRLPVVRQGREELEEDMAPFRKLAGLPAAMTAHVCYQALDPLRPATLSPVVIQELVRKAIGFDGLLLSDDLGMGALGDGPVGERAQAALRAGCDLVLHCSGRLDDMAALAERVRPFVWDRDRCRRLAPLLFRPD